MTFKFHSFFAPLSRITKDGLKGCISSRMIGNTRNGSTCNGVNGSNGHSENRNITVAIEGNIGSGKTSLLKFFRQNSLVEVIEEPVNKWQNVDGSNTLDLMYNDPKRWSYLFESYVLLTMMEIHHRPQNTPVRLLERSAYSARFCFMENLHKSGTLSTVEYTVFQQWFDYLIANEKPQIDLIVYLRTSPEKCMERIKKRSRDEETSVSMELLNSLHDRYEEWLIKKSKFSVPAPVVVVDGNKSLQDMFQFYETNAQLLLDCK
ncbi:hypothetical protein ACROYT_G011677 [Oculina patagonica]